MSRRSAPRREVKSVWKTGSYGNVKWHHELSCGHVETRKRKAPADLVGCVQCADQPLAKPRIDVDVDPVVQAEITTRRVKEILSTKLDLPGDSIQVISSVWDPAKVDGVRITLSPEQVQEIAER